jgi:hypothetical protein
MKNKSWRLGLLIVSVMMAVLAGGCSSTGSGKGAYPTLKNTQVNVDWPMTRYRNAVAAGRVTTGMQQQVDQAYKAYKEAFDAAVQAANNNYDATTPANVRALADQVISAVGAVPTF